jgi:hypothetical protein
MRFAWAGRARGPWSDRGLGRPGLPALAWRGLDSAGQVIIMASESSSSDGQDDRGT